MLVICRWSTQPVVISLIRCQCRRTVATTRHSHSSCRRPAVCRRRPINGLSLVSYIIESDRSWCLMQCWRTLFTLCNDKLKCCNSETTINPRLDSAVSSRRSVQCCLSVELLSTVSLLVGHCKLPFEGHSRSLILVPLYTWFLHGCFTIMQWPWSSVRVCMRVYSEVCVRACRCNLALMLMTDLVVDTSLCIDWTVHLPFILHLAILGQLQPPQPAFLLCSFSSRQFDCQISIFIAAQFPWLWHLFFWWGM